MSKLFVVIFAWLVLFALFSLYGCSPFMNADVLRELKDVMKDSSGCAYVQGSGGGGAGALGPAPLGGGYGQGSIAIARSGQGQATRCGPDGASTANPAP